ncbi:hypothetical protein ACFWMS_14625 [Peribacillus butanolivorans]
MWLPEKVIVQTSLDYVKEQGCMVDDSFSSFKIHILSLGVF